MKILLLSDVHLEFAPLHTKGRLGAGCDVVVLAGDIAEGTRGIRWARRSFPDHRIIYVAGNHEFYKHHWDRGLDQMRNAALESEIDFLENDEVTIGGVRFLGCTLWVDFCYFGTSYMRWNAREYERGMADCLYIRADRPGSMSPTGRGRLHSGHVLDRHRRSRQWLEDKLAQPRQKTVVVTHHAPCSKSVAERFRQDDLTPSFVSDLPQELLLRADVWVHGHMHDSSDYLVESELASTRIVCNPRGYLLANGAFENSVFEMGKIITI